MNNVVNSLYNFFTSLSLIDIVFFSAVVVLIILIILMIYVTRTEDNYIEEIDNKSSDNNLDIDLRAISNEIENAPARTVNLTPYEEEQEERAIISYDELISNTGKIKLNYEDASEDDGLLIKKVNVEELSIPNEELPKLASSEALSNTQVISYLKEEEFLATLKKMQQMLN